MFWETSWKTLKRSKGKTILLCVLLALISIFTILGYSMLDNCNYLLQQADEQFTTIGILEYTAGKYPDDAQITEKSKENIQKFDISKVLNKPEVLDYQEPFLMLGYCDKVNKMENQDNPFYFNSIIVFRVSYENQDGTYRCTLINPLYSNCSKEGTTFGLSNETLKNRENYNLKAGHLYIANGDFRKENNLLVFSLSTKTSMSEDKMKDVKIANFPITDITDQPEYLKSGDEIKEWNRIKNLYNIQNTSVQITATKSLKNYSDFYLGSSVINEGRLWTEKESQKGEKVCVVHAAVAAKLGLKLGDRFEVKTHYSDDSRFFYDSLNSEQGFRETVSLKVIGIYHKIADNSVPMIYVPENTLKALPKAQQRYNMGTVILKNGEGRAYQQSVQSMMTNHFSMSIYDQGYEQTVAPIYSMKTNATLILIMCSCCSIVILVLFGILFVIKQRETVAIMTSLGTKRKHILWYIEAGTIMMGTTAAIIGALTAFILSKSAVRLAYEMTKNTQQEDLRYSILAMGKQHMFNGEIRSSLLAAILIAGIMLLATIIICLVDGINIINQTKNFGGQKRRKRSRKTKVYSIDKIKEATFDYKDIQLTNESYSQKRARKFMFFTSRKSIFLNRKVNSILILTSLCISIFMVSYTMGIRKYGTMIDQAYKEIEVNASFRTVTGRKIPAEYIPRSVYGYMASAYNVKNYYRSIVNKYEYIGKIKETGDKEAQSRLEKELSSDSLRRMAYPRSGFALEERVREIKNDSTLAIVDDINRSEEFFREKPAEINFLKGYENIFTKPVEDDWNVTKLNTELPTMHAIVTKDFLIEKGLKLGDTVIVSHIILDRSGETYYHQPLKCKLVGEYTSTMEGNTMYISTLEKEKKMLKETIKDQLFTTDINYRLKNTDNLKLLKSKLEAEEIYSVGIWSSSRVSFVMEDAQLVETVNSYENGRSFMINLQYIIFLLIFLIGFVATYLAMRSRVSEMAIMRSLGTGSKRVFLIFFLEQTILAVSGMVLGIIVSFAYYGEIHLQEILMVVLFLVFFLGGSVISILQMNKKNVLKILSTAE